MHQITQEKATAAKNLMLNGLSVRKVAARLKLSIGSVSNIRQSIQEQLPEAKKGRPTKLSDQDKRYCTRVITSKRAETASGVSKVIKHDHGIDVSRYTVSRALTSLGMKAAEKQTKPALSAKNIQKRFDFAKRHQNWTVEDWKRVVWSDETKINRFMSDGRSWYWAREGTSLQSHHVKQAYKHGGGSLMVWGCMTHLGPGYMCKIDGRMDQHLYKRILEDELSHTIEYYGLDPCKVIFQHDNDPKHTAKSVKDWLSEQAFEVLTWPPQSPDLNPIEHLWWQLKNQLLKYEGPPSGMNELWERVEAEWNKLDASVCLKLVESMPRRVQAVIASKGKWTKY